MSAFSTQEFLEMLNDRSCIHPELIESNLLSPTETVRWLIPRLKNGIHTLLERLQLEIAVALDREGRVAEKYGATSIPQTVIIGRDGKVARLFVGGSARFDEQLRTALQSLLSDRAE